MRSQPPEPSLRWTSTTSARSLSNTFGISILTGHTSAQAPHRLEANGSQVSLGDAVKLRRDDCADRARVNPRIIVAADLAIHRAMIQARAATDAIERLAFFRISQQLGAAVVQQQQVEFVGTIDFARRGVVLKEKTCRP